MSIPGNGIFVVRGELSTIMTAMRRTSRNSWNYQYDNSDSLTKSFNELKESVLNIEDLKLLSPETFMSPFLEAIRSEETTGAVTSIALSAVNKFLSYGLIDPTNSNLPNIVQNIADAVTHARFVGSDNNSDGVVLLKIVQVLRTLMLSPEGSALSNESVCEIILSCFRICFETRLNELLRRTAEQALRDMILLLFMRLPQFVEDLNTFNIKHLKIRPEATAKNSGKAKSLNDLNEKSSSTKLETVETNNDEIKLQDTSSVTRLIGNEDAYTPYGIPCIRELFRFLISLCNPLDTQNNDNIIQVALNLLTVVLEVASDNIGNFFSLISLVKDELCKNLFQLLASERIQIFAANLQVCFLLFESLRFHLKYQLEYYLIKLTDIIGSENVRVTYEIRELALDNLLQMLRVPGFAAELYINYDCDLYCANIFENITKLLSKNALLATAGPTIYGTHLLSLDALFTIISSIDKNCMSFKKGTQITNKRHSRNNSTARADMFNDETTIDGAVYIKNMDTFIQYNTMYNRFSGKFKPGEILTEEKMDMIKNKKRILSQGTDLFNQRPEKGIQFLQENGLINATLDPLEIAHFLRESPGLDKKMIGEYISKKKNVENRILEVFVKSFDFTSMRIDKALRLYLETFRLPGEAPLIFLVMEHFADHWHKCNNEPFANTDAAFRLAYAIIMLNMDQHNHNAKKLNIPMTVEDFTKNLRGLNGNSDFDQEMLMEIFNSIKNEEIIMPAEQTGIVKENYLWKVLLRRGEGKDAEFTHVLDSSYDKQLFQVTWGSTLTAFGSLFDKVSEIAVIKKIIEGFMHSAAICSHYSLHQEFDAIILTLCKFTTLYNTNETNELTISVQFGSNSKARTALKSIFKFLHDYGDSMRESWKHVIDLLVQMYKLKLLPKSFVEIEDFCEPSGKLLLQYEPIPIPKSEASLLSSLYLYLSSESQRQPTHEEHEILKIAKKCIKDCQIDQMIIESKFLHPNSLAEIISYLVSNIKPPTSHKSVDGSYEENLIVFYLEFLTKILIQNRDRVLPFWQRCSEVIHQLIVNGASCGYANLLRRSTVALLKLGIYLMRNEELAPTILQSMRIFLQLKPKILQHISIPVSIGMYELLKTSAQNIHTECDWMIVFKILECVGAGAISSEANDSLGAGTKSDGALSSEDEAEPSERGYTSDSEMLKNSSPVTPQSIGTENNWIIVNKEQTNDPKRNENSQTTSTIVYPCKLMPHSPIALVKCWDSLAFIVRNVAHITPYNFEICVKCIRTFVEASMVYGNPKKNIKNQQAAVHGRKNIPRKIKSTDNLKDVENQINNEVPERYETIAIQLLDLMHTLYSRIAQIFRWWAEESGSMPQCSALWSQGWCPLLQGIARISTDHRKEVRTSAIACLQRALLMHDLKTLSGPEWAGCFRQVIFPLTNFLLTEKNQNSQTESALIEESRIMSKVFLHHLTPLMALTNFNELWFEIIQYMEKFMKLGTDMLYEAVLESLKNMLLVMYSVKAFHNPDGVTYSNLWEMTWNRIGLFLPTLREELFKDNDNPMLNVSARAIPSPVVSPVIEQKEFAPTETITNSQILTIGNNDVSAIVDQSSSKEATSTNDSELAQNITEPQTIDTNLFSKINDVDEQMERFSETSSIELIIQGGPNDQQNCSAPPRIPESHMMNFNPYPGVKNYNHIPVDIVKSYTPVAHHDQQQVNHPSSEIYDEYATNPYNLTLQIDSNNIGDNSHSKLVTGTSTFFQSSNYFNNDSNENMPPGSELFNRP
ncbi:hypothetical protein PVAND_008098 [Polypedilum vanderplanki]|uniref:SEC7 domain-containing protein n=1 Tax=Polypedilum vanderplanki TaxID=319348 RepID=A0A9J6C972_POLVA|nr:hypothetical protein PVAND_008098 [Polypedilum vanderplanki]